MKKLFLKFCSAKRYYAVIIGIIAAVIISFVVAAIINLVFFYSI